MGDFRSYAGFRRKLAKIRVILTFEKGLYLVLCLARRSVSAFWSAGEGGLARFLLIMSRARH